MSIERNDLTRMIQMALNEVRIVPSTEGECAYATNAPEVELTENYTEVCTTLMTIPQRQRVCHIAFTAVVSTDENATFDNTISAVITLNGQQQSKVYQVAGNTINFIDFMEFEIGTYQVSVQMKIQQESAGQRYFLKPRSCKLGVYL